MIHFIPNNLPRSPLAACASILCKIADFYFPKNNKVAKLFYQKALRLNPKAYQALCGMGFIHLLAENFSDAIEYFENALQEYPSEARAYKGLADTYQEMKEFTKSESAYKKALSKKSDYFKAKLALVDLYIDSRKLDAALQVLNTCEPEKYAVRYLSAKIFYFQEEYSKALKYMIPLFEEDPSRIELAHMIGGILYNQGALERALTYFERYNSRQADFDALFLTAASYDRLGDHSKAARAYKEALILNPSSTDVLYRLGLQAKIERDFLAARDFFEKIITLTSDLSMYAKALYSLARAEKELGNRQRAVELYEKCLTNHYNESSVLFYLAEIYEELGEQEKAQYFREKRRHLGPEAE